MIPKATREEIDVAIREKRFLFAVMLIERAALDMNGRHEERAALIATTRRFMADRGTSAAAPRACRELAAHLGGPIAELWGLLADTAETLPVVEAHSG